VGSASQQLGPYANARILDRHPDGRHVAFQVLGDFRTGALEERAGIWDTGTNRLVWNLGDATAYAWFPGGLEVAAVTCVFNPAPGKRGVAVTPFQAEFAWFFETRSWPDGDLRDGCLIRSSTGWFDRISVSPTGDLAAPRWVDQTETGFVLVRIRDGGVEQIAGVEWATTETNWVEGPAFNRGGDRLAVSTNPAGATNWWGGEEDDDPSPGGLFVVGHLIVLDRELRERHREPVGVDVPDGWLAGERFESRGLGPPRFVDGETIAIEVPIDGERQFRLPDDH
jgi:hypothetical protein